MNRRGFLHRSASLAAIGGVAGLGRSCGYALADEKGGVTFAGYAGGDVRLSRKDIASFARGLEGAVLHPGDNGYDHARSIWNASIDRRPKLIARPASPEDMWRTVKFASENGVSLSIRGGGHNHNGYAVSDSGMMMDLSQMRAGDVSLHDKSAVVEPGMTFAQFDGLTHKAGLAATGAIVSMVGLPGYTLGGGIGWLHRKFGAGCDNLIGADIVTASGDLVRANARENEDLLWALRGGGGNFGAAARLHYRLHELDSVYAGLIFYSLEDLDRVGRFLDGYLDGAPDDLNVWMLHRMAPPSPLLEKSVHGKPVLILAVTWTGGQSEGERITAPLLKAAVPLGASLKRRSYPEWQSALDAAWGDGFCNEWVGGYLNAYDADVRNVISTFVNAASSPFSDFKVALLGGEFSRAGAADAAFGHRDAKYAYVIQTRWLKTEEARRHLAWTYEFHRALRAIDAGGVYVNFIGKEEPPSRVADAYEPERLKRLRAIKSSIDPDNFFNQNANIKPT